MKNKEIRRQGMKKDEVGGYVEEGEPKTLFSKEL